MAWYLSRATLRRFSRLAVEGPESPRTTTVPSLFSQGRQYSWSPSVSLWQFLTEHFMPSSL